MSLQAGLSFDQAPPFGLPLQFFLTAPLFLLAAGLLIMLAPEALSSRWLPQTLALTHALTLGFLSMTMAGALLQMLPVVAGSSVPKPHFVAGVSHAGLTLGTAALMTGFLTHAPRAFEIGVFLLGGGFLVFLVATSCSLARAVSSVTVTGMRIAVTDLSITILIGLALALMHAGRWIPPAMGAAVSMHGEFGLIGWVLLLVIAVAYQVVPMFQITPPYPPRLSRWLAVVMFSLLLLRATAALFFQAATVIVDACLAAGILLFAIATLHLQSRRRRKLPDVTLDYWRLGMANLIACATVWITAQFWPAWASNHVYPVLLGVLFIAGFAVSVVSGMLYKIVPFLAWFHLQAQLQARAGSIPTMKDMIAERWKRRQFHLHLSACALLIGAVFWPHLVLAAGGVLALSALLLEINLLSAVRKFSLHGGRLF